jgi:putative exporter of polyketide antibiotics
VDRPLLGIAAISGFLLALQLFGWVPRLSTPRATIPRLLTMDRVIITVALTEFGSLATGREDGLPTVGRGPGSQAIGSIGDK